MQYAYYRSLNNMLFLVVAYFMRQNSHHLRNGLLPYQVSNKAILLLRPKPVKKALDLLLRREPSITIHF